MFKRNCAFESLGIGPSRRIEKSDRVLIESAALELKENASKEALDAFTNALMPFLAKMANRYYSKLPTACPIDDPAGFVSLGYQAALSSHRRWTPELSEFMTFATPRIQGCFSDAVRTLTKDVWDRRNACVIAHVDSINRIVAQSGNNRCANAKMKLGDILYSGIEAPNVATDAQDEIRALMACLNDREKFAFALSYLDRIRLSDIGDMMGISESRVSQILSRCRKKIADSDVAKKIGGAVTTYDLDRERTATERLSRRISA